MLLARKGRDNVGGAARAAEDIARQAAREMLAPLLDAACARLAFVLRRSVDAAAERAARAGAGRELLQPYTAFHAALRAAHASFVAALEAKARGLLRHHLDAATSEFALSLMAGAPDVAWGGGGGGGGNAGSGSGGDEGAQENVPPEEQEQDLGVGALARWGLCAGCTVGCRGLVGWRGRLHSRARPEPRRRPRCCRRARRSGHPR